MTEKELRMALTTILGNEDNPEMLRDLYDDHDSDMDVLIRKAVDDLFSQKLLDYINSKLELVRTFSIEDKKFKHIVSEYDETRDPEESGPLFDLLDDHKVCVVGDEAGESITLGEDCLDDIMKIVTSETYINEKGDVFTAIHEMVEYEKEIHMIRKTDAKPWSLSALAYEGLFPEKFKDFWE